MKQLFLLIFISLGNVLQGQIIIPLKKVNGVNNIEVTVNNQPINFVFDTGAASTIISKPDFMKLERSHGPFVVISNQSYEVADGSVISGKTYIADSIKIGDIYLYNVEFSVLDAQNSHSLLGQNIFEKFYSIEIQSNHIRLTPRNYNGDDLFKKHSHEEILEISLLTFETYFLITFSGLTNLEYTLVNSRSRVDKYDSTVIMEFDLYTEKMFKENFSRSKFQDPVTQFSKQLVSQAMYEIFSHEETNKTLFEDITMLKIEEFQINVCIPFLDKEYCFKRKVFTDQIPDISKMTDFTKIVVY
jgi:clan AA aspartic protease (TIGR02281 family)